MSAVRAAPPISRLELSQAIIRARQQLDIAREAQPRNALETKQVWIVQEYWSAELEKLERRMVAEFDSMTDSHQARRGLTDDVTGEGTSTPEMPELVLDAATPKNGTARRVSRAARRDSLAGTLLGAQTNGDDDLNDYLAAEPSRVHFFSATPKFHHPRRTPSHTPRGTPRSHMLKGERRGSASLPRTPATPVIGDAYTISKELQQAQQKKSTSFIQTHRTVSWLRTRTWLLYNIKRWATRARRTVSARRGEQCYRQRLLCHWRFMFSQMKLKHALMDKMRYFLKLKIFKKFRLAVTTAQRQYVFGEAHMQRALEMFLVARTFRWWRKITEYSSYEQNDRCEEAFGYTPGWLQKRKGISPVGLAVKSPLLQHRDHSSDFTSNSWRAQLAQEFLADMGASGSRFRLSPVEYSRELFLERVIWRLLLRQRLRRCWEALRESPAASARDRRDFAIADEHNLQRRKLMTFALWRLRQLNVDADRRYGRFWVRFAFRSWRYIAWEEKESRIRGKEAKIEAAKRFKLQAFQRWRDKTARKYKKACKIRYDLMMRMHPGRESDLLLEASTDEAFGAFCVSSEGGSSPLLSHQTQQASSAFFSPATSTVFSPTISHAGVAPSAAATARTNKQLGTTMQYSLFIACQHPLYECLVKAWKKLKLYVSWRKAVGKNLALSYQQETPATPEGLGSSTPSPSVNPVASVSVALSQYIADAVERVLWPEWTISPESSLTLFEEREMFAPSHTGEGGTSRRCSIGSHDTASTGEGGGGTVTPPVASPKAIRSNSVVVDSSPQTPSQSQQSIVPEPKYPIQRLTLDVCYELGTGFEFRTAASLTGSTALGKLKPGKMQSPEQTLESEAELHHMLHTVQVTPHGYANSQQVLDAFTAAYEARRNRLRRKKSGATFLMGTATSTGSTAGAGNSPSQRSGSIRRRSTGPESPMSASEELSASELSFSHASLSFFEYPEAKQLQAAEHFFQSELQERIHRDSTRLGKFMCRLKALSVVEASNGTRFSMDAAPVTPLISLFTIPEKKKKRRPGYMAGRRKAFGSRSPPKRKKKKDTAADEEQLHTEEDASPAVTVGESGGEGVKVVSSSVQADILHSPPALPRSSTATFVDSLRFPNEQVIGTSTSTLLPESSLRVEQKEDVEKRKTEEEPSPLLPPPPLTMLPHTAEDAKPVSAPTPALPSQTEPEQAENAPATALNVQNAAPSTPPSDSSSLLVAVTPSPPALDLEVPAGDLGGERKPLGDKNVAADVQGPPEAPSLAIVEEEQTVSRDPSPTAWSPAMPMDISVPMILLNDEEFTPTPRREGAPTPEKEETLKLDDGTCNDVAPPPPAEPTGTSDREQDKKNENDSEESMQDKRRRPQSAPAVRRKGEKETAEVPQLIIKIPKRKTLSFRGRFTSAVEESALLQRLVGDIAPDPELSQSRHRLSGLAWVPLQMNHTSLESIHEVPVPSRRIDCHRPSSSVYSAPRTDGENAPAGGWAPSRKFCQTPPVSSHRTFVLKRGGKGTAATDTTTSKARKR